MQAIAFRASRRSWIETLHAWTMTLIGVLGLVGLVQNLWLYGSLAETWSRNPVMLSQSAILTILGFSAALVGWFQIPNRLLQLDDEGLTYAEGRFRTRRWRWDELSAFKPWRRWRFQRIAFVVTAQSNRSVWLARNLDLPEGLLVQIEDIYDTPLDEIAAKLNEYRDRAFGREAGVPA